MDTKIRVDMAGHAWSMPFMARWLTLFLIVLLAVSCSAGTNTVVVAEGDLVAALRAENEALRLENQMLRRELVSKKGSLPDSLLPVKAVDPEVKFELPSEDTGFWLSAKTRIRHGRRCRNYRKVKGRPCGPNDGKPCKICEGK